MDSKHRHDQNYHTTSPSCKTNPPESDGKVPRSETLRMNNNIGEYKLIYHRYFFQLYVGLYKQLSYHTRMGSLDNSLGLFENVKQREI